MFNKLNMYSCLYRRSLNETTSASPAIEYCAGFHKFDRGKATISEEIAQRSSLKCLETSAKAYCILSSSSFIM